MRGVASSPAGRAARLKRELLSASAVVDVHLDERARMLQVGPPLCGWARPAARHSAAQSRTAPVALRLCRVFGLQRSCVCVCLTTTYLCTQEVEATIAAAAQVPLLSVSMGAGEQA